MNSRVTLRSFRHFLQQTQLMNFSTTQDNQSRQFLTTLARVLASDTTLFKVGLQLFRVH